MSKILLLITKAEIGGAQMSVLALARELKKAGHTVAVGAGSGGFLPEELEKERIEFIRFKHLKRTHNPLALPLFVLELKRFLDRRRFDVVHINSSNALSASLAAKFSKNKPKTIFTFRGLSMLDPNYRKAGILKAAYRAYFKFLLGYVDQKVFVSQANLDYALKRGIVPPKPGSYSLIYNGIDAESLGLLEPVAAKNRLWSHLNADPENKITLGAIGRLCYAKNYEFLIRIFPKLLLAVPSAVLVIIGDGPERKRLASLVDKYGLGKHIYFAGELHRAGKYLRAFDVFTLPSRYEGLSITLLEAVHSGVPILASRVGGTPEALDRFDPELFELDNMDEYIDKFKKLLPSSPERQTAIDFNLNLAKKFDIKNTVEKYLKIY